MKQTLITMLQPQGFIASIPKSLLLRNHCGCLKIAREQRADVS